MLHVCILFASFQIFLFTRSLQADSSTMGTLCTVCASCGQSGNVNQQCVYCLQLALSCAVCHLPIRGLAFACGKCNHVSHPEHIQDWFSNDKSQMAPFEESDSDPITICPWPTCECQCTNNPDQVQVYFQNFTLKKVPNFKCNLLGCAKDSRFKKFGKLYSEKK